MRIRKAEDVEKKNYQGMHPLYGYVKVRGVFGGVQSSWQVPVEYLGEGKGEPNYEAILPNGLHLVGDCIHTVLGATQADLLERLAQGMKECDAYCHELNGPREIA